MPPQRTNQNGRRWEVAIAALLSEPTVEQAATKAKLKYRTLKYWLAQPAFQAVYRQARLSILDRTVSLLLAANVKAVERLQANLTCGNPAAENRAAELILTHSARGVEILDLAAKLAELKREMEEVRHHGHGDHANRARGRGQLATADTTALPVA